MEPLNCHLYEVKGRVYRRNVPLEQIGRWNPNTNGRIFNGADDEEPLECIVASGGTYLRRFTILKANNSAHASGHVLAYELLNGYFKLDKLLLRWPRLRCRRRRRIERTTGRRD